MNNRGEFCAAAVLAWVKTVLRGLIVPDGVRAVCLGVRRGVPPNLA